MHKYYCSVTTEGPLTVADFFTINTTSSPYRCTDPVLAGDIIIDVASILYLLGNFIVHVAPKLPGSL